MNRSAPCVTACSNAQRIDKENKLAEKFWSEHAGLKGTQSLDSSPQHHRPRHEYAESVAATSAAPTGYTSKSMVRRCICTYDKNAVGGAMHVVTMSLLCLPCALVQYLRDRLDKLERELQQEKQYRVKVRAKLGSPPCLGVVAVFCLGPRAPGLTTSSFLHCKVEFMRSAVALRGQLPFHNMAYMCHSGAL